MEKRNDSLDSTRDSDPDQEEGDPALRTDPIPVERDDTPEERLAASTAPRPIVGYAPVNSAFAGSPMGLTGTGGTMLGGSFMGGPPTVLGLDAARGSAAEDGRISDAAEEALAEEPRLATLAAAGIQVSVAYGVVELDGAVPTEADWEIAEEVVAHLPGVAAVENRLRIEG